jgi:hypothetical protein
MDELMMRMLQLAAKGYVCSQIMIKLALELRGEENPALVRAMAGPGYGCGSGAATCGALMGGGCVLALYAAPAREDEVCSEQLIPMQEALGEWFQERIGRQHDGIACDQIVGAGGPAASRQRCGSIVAETYAKVMEILGDHGIDPVGA